MWAVGCLRGKNNSLLDSDFSPLKGTQVPKFTSNNTLTQIGDVVKLNTELIVYLLRKTSLTREEIGKLTPRQFNEIIKEVRYQESVEDYRNQFAAASLLAAIYNTIPRKKGSKVHKATDFISGDMPKRNKTDDSVDKLADEKRIRLPTKELRERK